MKTNNNSKGGALKPEYYDAYARYFVKYVQGMKAEGIHIDAITVQNEPLNPKNTPSMVMQAPEQAVFIKSHLGPAFRAAGIKTKIVLYDHNCDVPEYATAILADPDAARFVDGSGFHLYGGKIEAMSQVHDAYPGEEPVFHRADGDRLGGNQTVDQHRGAGAPADHRRHAELEPQRAAVEPRRRSEEQPSHR